MILVEKMCNMLRMWSAFSTVLSATFMHVLKRCKRKHPLFFYAMVANYGYVLKLYELNGKILMNILNYFEY
jgi:hypothetical protein